MQGGWIEIPREEGIQTEAADCCEEGSSSYGHQAAMNGKTCEGQNAAIVQQQRELFTVDFVLNSDMHVWKCW